MMQETEFRAGVIKPVECYKEAWEVIKDQYWIVFATVFVGLVIGNVLPIVLMGPMMCGIYLVLFHKIAGRPIEVGMLFKGFDYFLPGLILTLIVTLPTLVLIGAVYIPMVGIALAAPNMGEAELTALIAGAVAVELVVVVIVVCLHTLLLFSFPLVVDKKMTAMQAVKTSARAVWNNLGGVVGLYVVGFVVCFAGILIFCIGIYLAIPIMMAANTVAYRKVFPAEGPGYSAPYLFRGQ